MSDGGDGVEPLDGELDLFSLLETKRDEYDVERLHGEVASEAMFRVNGSRFDAQVFGNGVVDAVIDGVFHDVLSRDVRQSSKKQAARFHSNGQSRAGESRLELTIVSVH